MWPQQPRFESESRHSSRPLATHPFYFVFKHPHRGGASASNLGAREPCFPLATGRQEVFFIHPKERKTPLAANLGTFSALTRSVRKLNQMAFLQRASKRGQVLESPAVQREASWAVLAGKWRLRGSSENLKDLQRPEKSARQVSDSSSTDLLSASDLGSCESLSRGNCFSPWL